MTPEPVLPADGVFENISPQEYRAWRAINGSSLVEGRISMKHMHHEMTRTDDDDATSAMTLGTLGHMAILEPERFKRMAVWSGPKRGNPWTAFKEEHGEDNVISESDAETVKSMCESVMADHAACRIVTESRKEISLVWTGQYGRAKCRPDMLTSGEFADLKTTERIHRRAFQNQYESLGYYIKMAWMIEGLHAHKVVSGIGNEMTGYVICAETKPPFDVVVYELEEDGLHVGLIEANKLAMQYRCHAESGSFAGVAAGEILRLNLPQWKLEQDWEVKR